MLMIMQSVNQEWEQSLLALAQEAAHIPPTRSDSMKDSSQNMTLNAAYARCEAVTAEHSRSFSLATALLPREQRRAVRALYAFCRLADNLVDEAHDQPGPALHQLKESLRHTQQAGSMHDDAYEILTAWADARARYHVPVQFAEQLLDGVGRDLCHTRYASFDELAVYCYGVASTVGLMSMHIIGFTPEAVPYAVKMGVALQLTNILRDIGDDWRAGRLYLPLNELAAFGLTENDLAAQQVDARWRELMRFQIARNRQLYAEAWPGITYLEPRGRLAVVAAVRLYRGILEDIEAHDYDVFNRRAHVSDLKKMALLGRLLLRI